MESLQPLPSVQYLDEKTAAEKLGVSVSMMANWRRRGGGPRFAKFGKAVRYDVRDLDAFGESMKSSK